MPTRKHTPNGQRHCIALLALACACSAGAHASASAPVIAARDPQASAPMSVPAASVAAPWWAGFSDPVLDTLLTRLNQGGALPDADRRELQAQVATLYVQLRALTLRARLLDERLQLLSDEARAWTAQGPTPEAAQAVGRLQTQHALLDEQQTATLQRVATMKTVLSRLEGSNLPLPDDLDARLADPSPPAFAPQPASARLALQWSPGALREQLARDEEALGQAVAQWQTARQALTQVQSARRAGLADDAALLRAIEALMQRVDAVTEAATTQALSWIRVYAVAPDGAR
jgi:hypothetical protein